MGPHSACGVYYIGLVWCTGVIMELPLPMTQNQNAPPFQRATAHASNLPQDISMDWTGLDKVGLENENSINCLLDQPFASTRFFRVLTIFLKYLNLILRTSNSDSKIMS